MTQLVLGIDSQSVRRLPSDTRGIILVLARYFCGYFLASLIACAILLSEVEA
jgi:hypothetical protein